MLRKTGNILSVKGDTSCILSDIPADNIEKRCFDSNRFFPPPVGADNRDKFTVVDFHIQIPVQDDLIGTALVEGLFYMF